MQEVRFQWQNLTLFLAALGGSCVQEGQDLTTLSKVIPVKYLPDKMRVVQNPIPLVESFIGDLLNLLVAGDMQIRDIVRDALGSELSPRLYSRLIRNLETLVFVFCSDGVVPDWSLFRSFQALEVSAESADIEKYAVVIEQVSLTYCSFAKF